MSSHRAAKALSSASSEQDHLHVFPKKGTDDNGRQVPATRIWLWVSECSSDASATIISPRHLSNPSRGW